MESSFCHYGTPKMKWGVRRYQNKDGSLTPEGKKRYGSSDLSRKSDSELSETVKRKNLEKAYRKAIKSDNDGIEKAKKLTDASKTAADSAKDRRAVGRKQIRNRIYGRNRAYHTVESSGRKQPDGSNRISNEYAV